MTHRQPNLSSSSLFSASRSTGPLSPTYSALSSPLASPMHSPSSAAGGSFQPFQPPALTRRGSAFLHSSSSSSAPVASLLPSSVATALARQVFAKQGEDVYAALGVLPRPKPGAAPMGGTGAREDESSQPYLLVITSSSAVGPPPPAGAAAAVPFGGKKSDAAVASAPKLHWVKVKSGEGPGGDVVYSWKKSKPLRMLKRVDLSGGGGGAVGGGVRGREDFSLVLRSGDGDKTYSFALAPPSSSRSASGNDRNTFVWFLLESCRAWAGFVPASNVDTVLYQQLSAELTAMGSAEAGMVPPHLRAMLAAVSRTRVALAESDSKALSRSKSEERVLVPSMTTEETRLVQQFLKQIESAAAEKKGNSVSNSAEAGHSHIIELESFLQAKLASLERAHIASLLDPALSSRNSDLQSAIQDRLLDSSLEEISMWLNHHNLELAKMKKGIELIEARNGRLDVAETNARAMADTLTNLLDNLKLDTDPQKAAELESLLLRPDFGPSRLDATLSGVQRLDRLLQRELVDSRLEELAAVKERRRHYETLRASFCKHATEALEGIFADVAKRAAMDAQREAESAASAGSPALTSNSGVHRELRRYAALVRYLERLAPSAFRSLRSSYAASLRQVYEVKTRVYFAALRKSLAGESHDARWQSFPDWTPGTRLRSTDPTPASSLPAGKQLATRAFVSALDQLAPMCQREERFLADYFGRSPTSPDEQGGKDAAAGSRPRGSSVSTNTADGGAGGGGGGSSTAGVSSNARAEEEVRSLMGELFRGLEGELRELAHAAGKMDPFYTLELLVHCERLLAAQQAAASADSSRHSDLSSTRCDFLESILTSVSTHLKLSFTSFIDAEVAWLHGLHPNPKRCGVLDPFLKFPALVARMERVVAAASGSAAIAQAGAGESRSQSADMSYQKLASALFRWLDGVARSDEKYTALVYLENAHFFLLAFGPGSASSPSSSSSASSSSASRMHVPALAQFGSKAESLYAEHLRSYVSWHLEYEMPSIAQFWRRLEEQLKSIPPEDVPFASGLSKHDLRALCKGPLATKQLQKSLQNVIKRIEKHMPKNGQLARFEQLVSECYQNEKLPITQPELADLMKAMMPNAAAAAAHK